MDAMTYKVGYQCTSEQRKWKYRFQHNSYPPCPSCHGHFESEGEQYIVAKKWAEVKHKARGVAVIFKNVTFFIWHIPALI